MRCLKCYTVNPDGSIYCCKCGNKLPANETQNGCSGNGPAEITFSLCDIDLVFPLSGKGNYSSPYTTFVDEFVFESADDKDDFRSLDAQIFHNYFEKKDAFMMDVGLYVGTFDNNKPVKAKCYEYGKLVHDGKWRDFDDPVD